MKKVMITISIAFGTVAITGISVLLLHFFMQHNQNLADIAVNNALGILGIFCVLVGRL